MTGHGSEGEERPDGDVRGGLDFHVAVVDGQLEVVDQQNAKDDLAQGQVRLG